MVRGTGRPSLTQATRVHLSVVIGLLLVLYGVQTLLDRYALLLGQSACSPVCTTPTITPGSAPSW
ncbi:MAG: hypothetical protein R2719_10365 [Micropruina sp.]